MILKMLSTKVIEEILKLSREKATLIEKKNKDKKYTRYLDRNFACHVKYSDIFKVLKEKKTVNHVPHDTIIQK